MIKLVGLLLVAVGFALRINTLLVVVVAALVTGLVSAMSFHDILRMIGGSFIDQRFLVLALLLMLPVVGLAERHGLKERIGALMRQARAATAGRVLWLYQVVRGATSMLGLSIGNHASMVRPLVVPMAEGAERAAAAKGEKTPRANGGVASAPLRAHAAASENVGNFFSDDVIVAVGALLLIQGVFKNVGVEVALSDLKWWSLPTAVWVLAVGWWRYRALDRRLARERNSAGSALTPAIASSDAASKTEPR